MTSPTLLDITQNILSEMNSDSVNSISDTVESLQVATVVKNIFNEIVDEHNVISTRTRIQLDASTDPAKPTHMTLRSEHAGLESVYYDIRAAASDPLDYKKIEQVLPDEFLRRTMSRDSTDTTENLVVNDVNNTILIIRRNHHPSYFTTFDDDTLIFDAWDEALESTLQTSKTVCYAKTRPQFQLDDTYIPELPENLMTLLLAESKSHCFNTLKQMPNTKVEQSARRMRVNAQDYKQRVKTQDRWAGLPYPDFGRRRP